MSREQIAPEGQSLPLSRTEAKRVAAALIVHPIAFLVWVGGLFTLIADNRSPVAIGAMVIAFITVAIVTIILFGATIRIVGRSGKSFAAMMLDFQTRVPWRLAFGDLGRQVFELAGWPMRMLWDPARALRSGTGYSRRVGCIPRAI